MSFAIHPTTRSRLSDIIANVRTIAALAVIYSMIILTVATASLAQQKVRADLKPGGASADAPARIGDEGKVSPEIARQIEALDVEKESRTPAEQKIDSQLLYAAKMYRGEQIADGIAVLDVDVGLSGDGFVTVDISAPTDDDVLNAIKIGGGEILLVSKVYESIRARVSILQLEAIASLDEVRFIQPKQEVLPSPPGAPAKLPAPESTGESRIFDTPSLSDQQLLRAIALEKVLPNGTVSTGNSASEGDAAHRASTVRGTFNVNGTGVKIGVLSDGVTTVAASQTSGDLGAVTILAGQDGSGDRGTAMLEVIHDLAPGAQLYFAASTTSIVQFAQNIRDLRTAGCDIIVDDTTWATESPFQDGTPGATNTNAGVVTQAVNDVVALGAVYFSANTNVGNKNDVTSTAWEGDFVSGGTLAIVPGGGLVNDFDPGAGVAQSDIITVGGGTGVPINLSWNDPLGGSSNDYDLFVLNNAGTVVSTSSTNVQSGTQDPYEQVTTNNTTGRRVVIRQKAGAANRFLHLGANGGRLTFTTAGEIHGHAAASGGYGVASSPAFTSRGFPPLLNAGPYPNAFTTANRVETSSSDGPRRIFYQGDGTAITPADLTSTGGQVLQQPLIAAADGIQVSGAGAFSTPFFGTSAAAAHAAAIAALLKSADPTFTQAQIKTALTTTAVDIETAGTDRDAGFGIVMPYPALQSLGAAGKAFIEPGTVTATETCCNANGLIERGETASLTVLLNNPGLLNATGITTTLSTSTAGVQILSGSSAYADLAATSGTGSNTTPFSFMLTNFAAPDTTVDFALTINYAGGWTPSQVIRFSVETGRLPITTVLDATAPPTSISFPVTGTGTQTNLVFPDDPESRCAAPTAFPGTLTSTTPRYELYSIVNIVGAPVCATITLTADKSANGAIQAVAYTGAFNPASVGTNYAADPGFAQIATPGLTASFSVLVPAGGTLTVIVVELKSPGNGFPTAIDSTYTLKVSNLPTTPGPPTAASVPVSGQVTAAGRGVSNARVTLTGEDGRSRTAQTGAFGYFRFEAVEAGQTYVVAVGSKRFRFAPRVVTVNDELAGLDFEAQ